MTLPATIKRCPGAIYDDGSMREGCDDCQRRTCPPVDPERVLMMAPPAIIAFECEWRITPSDGAKP